MKKLSMVVLILCLMSFAYAEDTTEELIELTQQDELSQQAYESFVETSDNQGLNLFLQAHFMVKNYDYGQAYTTLEQALVLTEEDILKREILYYLGEIDRKFDDTPALIKRGLELKRKSHEVNDLIGIVRSNHMLASSYFSTYDVDEAMAYADEALSLSATLDYDLGIWDYHILMGNILVREDKAEEALDHYRKALDYLETEAFSSIFTDLYAMTENRMSYALFFMDRIFESRERVERAIEATDPEDHFTLAKNYLLRGYRYKNNREDAIENLEISLEHYKLISRKEQRDTLYVLTLELLAENYHLNGQYKESSMFYNEATNHYETGDYFDAVKGAYEDLDAYKYEGFQEKVLLLEELAKSKDEALLAQKKLFVFLVSGAMLAVVLLLVILMLMRFRKKSKDDMYVSSITDELTHIFNRSHILELLDGKLEGDNALVLIDLDDFSKVNSDFGYHIGDEVLKTVAGTLSHSVRGEDVLGRYGGEEFLIILENASQDECRLVAERVRKSVEACKWDHDDLHVTCSIGVTRMYTTDPNEILKRATDLVLEAKDNGKNQVTYG